jgi:hypothetical protein
VKTVKAVTGLSPSQIADTIDKSCEEWVYLESKLKEFKSFISPEKVQKASPFPSNV